MAKRNKIGIIYSYDEDWIGGTYYVQNIIRILNYLPKDEQLELNILTKEESIFEDLKKQTGYANLKYMQYPLQFNFLEAFINKVSRKLFSKKFIVKRIKLDTVFPLLGVIKDLNHINVLLFWIPDFQEKYLPAFFSEVDIIKRQANYKNIIASNRPIVFSSYSALNDFNTFFPDAKNEKKVFRFSAVHPNIEGENIETVKLKYEIEENYFISPNQFWQHKNQIAIIEAVKIIKDKGFAVKVIFTGKEYDHRNPDYCDSLKRKVKEYQLENEILFLGFIDRIEQLLLIKNAQAVIQPSFFEGWSTVVEDSKAFNQTLIVSDIEVHREQLEAKGYYFDPINYEELAALMIEVIQNPSGKLKYDLDYNERIKEAALDFVNLIGK